MQTHFPSGHSMAAVNISGLHAHVGERVTVNGWVVTTRSSGKIAFVVVRDGSGYVQSPGKTAATNQPIGGTVDDKIYQSGRISPMAYRFTGLPAGAYQVELRFAEIQGKKPGKRQFDVIVNGTPFLIAFDISALAGENNALDRSLFVSVPASGEVTVQLAERQAHGEPLLNAVRVTHRPDH